MTHILDPTAHWTRELAHLRLRSLKARRGAPPSEGNLAEAALSACDALLRDLAGAHLTIEQLRERIRTKTAAWDRLFEGMPVAAVLTDAKGYILAANRAAGVLLNFSAKRLSGRELLVFSEDREAFATMLRDLGLSSELRASFRMRPRERRPVEVSVAVLPASEDEPDSWLWFLMPAQALPVPPITTADCEDLDVRHPH